MGVTVVFNYPVPEGKSGPMVVDSLQRNVELLGGSKSGVFGVDCDTYLSTMPSVSRTVNILHNTETPASCYAILDTGVHLVVDALFDDFMYKLNKFYHRKGKIESKGQIYDLGDFVIKIGSVTMASNFKGILVEVEYCPCMVPNDCWNLMKELLQSLLGSAAENAPSHLRQKMDATFDPADTMFQYLDLFNGFKKVTVTSPASR